MMKMRTYSAFIVAVIAALMWTTTATAQVDCPCNCYFSGDCPINGQFCSWGSLSVEDTCWWRQPKPEGVPGGGCTGDMDDWGQCDGICSPSSRSTILVSESRENVVEAVRVWGDALIDTAITGGGTPSVEWLERIGSIDFRDPDTNFSVWRIMVEVIILSGGPDMVQFPDEEQPTQFTVAMQAQPDDSAMIANAEFAVEAVLAELEQTGEGRKFIDQINEDALDHDLLGRICNGAPDQMTCLYWRLGTFVDVLAMSGRGGSGDRGGSSTENCKGCYADCVPDDDVNVFDLLDVLDDWGATDHPLSDIDQNGDVNVFDLLDVLANWGECVEFGA